MVVGLAKYLMVQGYKEKGITILTPYVFFSPIAPSPLDTQLRYVGQLLALRKALSSVVTVHVSDLDMVEISNMDEEEAAMISTPAVKQSNLRQDIRLATIDKYVDTCGKKTHQV